MRRLKGKCGQIWIETVIYTLIGLAIIGLVLTIAKPEIDAKKDEIAIEQAIEALTNIDNKIRIVFGSSVGNRRTVELMITNGEFMIDMENDKLSWTVDSSFLYSEEDVGIPVGKINVTTSRNDPWEVNLETRYGVDIQFDSGDEETKLFLPSPTPYKLTIENSGENSEGNIIVNFREV
jgi:type II secretory pathway pseudopilin PulG